MDNREIAAILEEIAVFSELAGENPFKSRAFQAVARTIEKHPEPVADLSAQGRLREIKGVGPAIEEVVKDAVATGSSSLLAELKGKFPEGITSLLSLPGVGPKKVKAIYEKLGVSTLGELEYACRENRLATLEGFGEKTQANVLKAIEFRKTTQSSRLYDEALAIGEGLAARARESGLFDSVDIAGSLRRGKATFKDIDILVVPRGGAWLMGGPSGQAAACPGPDPAAAEAIRALLLSFADQDNDGPAVIGAGDTKISIRHEGLQVDFRIVPGDSSPAALQHFTGSKEHNTALRSRAKAMGLKMSEWGVFDPADTRIPASDEAAVYAAVGLAWMPPELREADGEIEAAEAGTLPELVEARDFKGMIHVHSTASDGTRSVEEMARECMKRGYSWLCISDHSRSAAYAGGLSAEKLLAQGEEITALNRSLAPFRIFAGVESDILADGSLDYPPEVLDRLDFVIGSVHSKLTMAREEATERLVAAIGNPPLAILGHLSGRLLLSREGYPWDEARILEALHASGAALEHNCNPHRLDPDWPVLKRAARRGIKVAIDPDAHAPDGFDDMRYGIVMARKAWLTKGDILNCMEAEEIDAWFKARRR